jgi:hypothetical protein
MSLVSAIRTFGLAACLLAASATLAQAGPLSNRATVEQQGDGNAGAITQDGAANDALIGQYGYNNTATIRQDGFGNAACIIQSGAGHDGAITQAGNFNGVGIVQTPLRTRVISADQCARINARRAAQAVAQQNAARRSAIRR